MQVSVIQQNFLLRNLSCLGTMRVPNIEIKRRKFKISVVPYIAAHPKPLFSSEITIP